MAGEVFKNEFNGGMNQDLAKTKIPPNVYYEAFNFRPSTDKGLSDGALENIKGTIALTTIPDIAAVQKISLDLTVLGPIFITITHNGVGITSATAFNITAASTIEQLYNFLVNDVNFATALGTLYNIYYNNLYILLNPLDLLTVVVTPILGLTIDTSFIPAQSNLEVIGSTYINNDIYLLTTNNTTAAPGTTNPSSVGQIWKLEIDNTDNTAPTPTLIYNNYLNFSTYNAIAPSAILGRYENANIQRIYWTDFYNKLRTLNVVDPQAFALDISLIDVQPSSDFNIPIMTEIGSAPGTAVIPIGCYQLAYKLTNVSGSATTYSVPSNMIFVTPNNSANPLGAEELQTAGLNWASYRGEVKGTTTTKRIVWTIDNLDRDFTRIEAVVLVRETKNEIPKITRIFEGPITTDTIDITFDGDIYTADDVLSVSIEEYLTLANVFTRVKTITTKDNRLIVGNIDNSTNAELDFDARAYRFNVAGAFDIIDIKGSTSVTTYGITVPADYDNVPETSDAIAPFNLETTDSLYSDLGQFRADGITLGGEGKYISYEFVSVAVAADKTVEPIATQPLPIVSTNPDYTTDLLNLGVYSADKNGVDGLQEYPVVFPSAINDGMKYPQMNSIYWGYQNNEIYRIGIVFYDKSKNPYFTKWIGDIKMPDVFDTCPAANHQYEDGSLTGFTDYRKSFTTVAGTHGANEAYVCQLGLKINVNIPAELTDQIEGYSIVRVKREESDKRIIAEGIISNTYIDYGGSNYFLPIGNMDYDTVNTSKERISFITPNVLDSGLIVPGSGMKFICSSILSPSNVLQNIDIDGGFVTATKNKVLKMYQHDALVTPFEVNISNAALAGTNYAIVLSTETYNNMGFPGVTPAQGNPSYTIKLSSAIANSATGDEKFLVNLYNPILNQYGGNTYTDRANNEYIMCSHFRSTKTNTTDYNDSSFIYGGDVTNDIMDEQRIGVDWTSFPADHNSTLFLYPSSSPVNRCLRHGAHPNTSMEDTGAVGDVTDYYYNKVYSCQNDIIKFFPKPDPFIANSEFVNRFYISEIKINGELTDAWSIFKALNYWDVEGSYGGINGVSILQDQVYFIQDKAFGKLLVNPKTAITSTTGEEIQLGRGNVIDSHEYVSVETGSTHQFSFLKSAYSLYFVDTRHNKIYQFSQQRPLTPESDLKGMHGWCINNIYGNLEIIDKPVHFDSTIGINGIHGVYDYVNNELIYTLSRGEAGVVIGGIRPDPIQEEFTLVYNEKFNAFTGFYTHYPKNYITNNRVFLSPNPDNLQELHLHNAGDYGTFYGVPFDSSVEFTSNSRPETSKVFNNLTIQTEVQNGTTLVDTASGLTPVQETFNSIEVFNDHQSSGVIPLVSDSNIVRFFRSWRTEVPRNQVNAAYTSTGLFSRMMDKYLRIKLSFLNNNNKRMIFHNALSYFRFHKPS